jgi:hypothetical protein
VVRVFATVRAVLDVMEIEESIEMSYLVFYTRGQESLSIEKPSLVVHIDTSDKNFVAPQTWYDGAAFD